MEIVSRGDRKIEVLKKCSAPTFVEKWRERQLVLGHRGFGREWLKVQVEEWTYNLGSNKLMHFLTFNNSKLVDIESGDYGFNMESVKNSKNARCGKIISVGDKKIDVLKRCGAPTFKESFSVSDSFDENTMSEEEWTYNFGTTGFLTYIRFKHSKVVRVEHGDYGF